MIKCEQYTSASLWEFTLSQWRKSTWGRRLDVNSTCQNDEKGKEKEGDEEDEEDRGGERGGDNGVGEVGSPTINSVLSGPGGDSPGLMLLDGSEERVGGVQPFSGRTLIPLMTFFLSFFFFLFLFFSSIFIVLFF